MNQISIVLISFLIGFIAGAFSFAALFDEIKNVFNIKRIRAKKDGQINLKFENPDFEEMKIKKIKPKRKLFKRNKNLIK